MTVVVAQLYYTLSPEVGGPLAHHHALVRALEGSSVQLRTFDWSESRRRVGLIATVRALKRLVGEADLVHINGIYRGHAWLGRRFARKRGRPYLVSPHGHLQAYALSRKRLKKQGYLRLAGLPLLRDAVGIVASTPVEADAARRYAPSQTIDVISPGVSMSAQPAIGRVAGAPLNLLFVGRLHPHKDLPTAFAALRRLHERGLKARLTLVGDGDRDYVVQLQALARATSIEHSVRFLGWLDGSRKEAEIAAADLLLMPSHSENFSFAVAEALASGLPVVVTDQVGLAPVVAEYACGAVVPVAAAQAMSDAIQSLSAADILQRARAQARLAAAQRLSLTAARAALLALYQRLMPGAST